MRGVLQNVCSLFDTSVFIDIVCVNMCEWDTDDLCRGFFVCVRAAAEPKINAVCQDVFCCSSIECCHDLRRGFGLSQSTQEVNWATGLFW